MAGTEQAAWRRYAATPLVTHKDNASALGGGIISTALILLRHCRMQHRASYFKQLSARIFLLKIFPYKFFIYDYFCQVFYVIISSWIS